MDGRPHAWMREQPRHGRRRERDPPPGREHRRAPPARAPLTGTTQTTPLAAVLAGHSRKGHPDRSGVHGSNPASQPVNSARSRPWMATTGHCLPPLLLSPLSDLRHPGETRTFRPPAAGRPRHGRLARTDATASRPNARPDTAATAARDDARKPTTPAPGLCPEILKRPEPRAPGVCVFGRTPARQPFTGLQHPLSRRIALCKLWTIGFAGVYVL
jgi:hypothetical protein